MSDEDLIIDDEELGEHVYPAKSGIHGTGLFANRAIEAGEYIGTYWGPETSDNGMYVLWVYDEDDEENATGRDGKNLLRYLNHTVNCNAAFENYDLYAEIDIPVNGEITIDYGEDPVEDE